MPIRAILAMVHLRTSIRYSPHRQNCGSHRLAIEHLPIDGGTCMADYGELRQSRVGSLATVCQLLRRRNRRDTNCLTQQSWYIVSQPYKSLPAEGLAPHGTEDGGDGRM